MDAMKKHRFIDPKTQKSYVFWIRADFNPGAPSLINLLSASRFAYCEHDKKILRSPVPFEEIVDDWLSKG